MGEGARLLFLAAPYFRGKARAWWIFESFSLKNSNTSSYARFIKTLVGRFDGKLAKTHVVDQDKPQETKTLHMMGGTINPLQKTMREVDILHHTLLEARPLSHTPKQEGMEISLLKEDPIIRRLPMHTDEDEGNNVVTSRAHLVPHAE